MAENRPPNSLGELKEFASGIQPEWHRAETIQSASRQGSGNPEGRMTRAQCCKPGACSPKN